MKQCKDIALRIAELRDACGYSQEKMAEELELDLATYAAYEETGDDIPISVIYHIANKFGVDFTEIVTGKEAKLNTYHIVKAGQGREVDRYPGYRFEDLAFRFSQKIMQPLLVTIDPSDEPAALVTHSGQEFNIVLEGSMILSFGDKEFILNKGDSIYFNPAYPHGQKCNGSTKLKFLTVIAE